MAQATFAIPFAAPASLPVITATATDSAGNTSEVSTVRPVNLQAPAQLVRVVAGEPLIFSTAAGDGIAVDDPYADALEPVWTISLAVTSGALALSNLDGLSGSGNGTAALDYEGSLTAVNAALAGLRFAPAAQAPIVTTLSVIAQSAGEPLIRAQVDIVDGFGLIEVTSTADSGPGSLREAILVANLATGGSSTIDFAIPGTGVQTIVPRSSLPEITKPVLIDGFSQPGYSGQPEIELSGNAAVGSNGLTITGSDVTIRGLTIDGFTSGAGVLISGPAATSDWIYGNRIGTDPTGTSAYVPINSVF